MASTKNLIKAPSEQVYVKDVNDADDVKVLPSGKTIEYPYKITIVDGSEDTIFEEVSTNQIFTSDWESKFWKNKKGRTSYTFNASLLAIAKLMEAIEPESFKEAFNTQGAFDVNSIIGFSFKAVVVRLDDGRSFIDWVDTFKVNGIEVPNLDEEKEDEPLPEEPGESEEIDPADIPI